MADFSPYGYSQGMQAAASGASNAVPAAISARASRLNQQDENDAQAAALRADQAYKGYERLKASLDVSEKSALETYKSYVGLIGEATQNGATAEQIQQLATAALTPLQSHATALATLRAQATMQGYSPDMIELLPDPNRFVGDNLPLLQLTVNSALQKTPEGVAAREAEAKLAEARAISEKLGVPIEHVAQAMGVIPAPPQPFQALGPDGKPAFVERGANGLQPVPGATPIPSRGMTIETTPDGGVKVTMGGEEEVADGTTVTRNRLEKSILDSQEGMARLTEIQRSFQPRFLTYAGRFENWRLDVQSRINPESLSAEDRKFLGEYTDFTTNAVDNLNRYIRDMTGAQMSEFEADRLRKGIPDPERDGPNVFKAKMDSSVRQLALARARAIHVRNQGLDKMPFDALSIDDMDTIINRRADELTAMFARQNLPGSEARSRAIEQVRQEFGL